MLFPALSFIAVGGIMFLITNMQVRVREERTGLTYAICEAQALVVVAMAAWVGVDLP